MVDISAVINNQYPHFLYRRTSGNAVQNASGSWESTGDAVQLVGSCRDETGGRGSKSNTAQAVFRDYTALIQLPVGTEYIAEGTEVIVTDVEVAADMLQDGDFVERAKAEGIVRISGEVSKYDRGRLHNRIWI